MEKTELNFFRVFDDGTVQHLTERDVLLIAASAARRNVETLEEACEIIADTHADDYDCQGICFDEAEAASVVNANRANIAADALSPAAAAIAEDLLAFLSDEGELFTRRALEALEDGEFLAEKGWDDQDAVEEVYEFLDSPKYTSF